jgi:hypothetical protein
LSSSIGQPFKTILAASGVYIFLASVKLLVAPSHLFLGLEFKRYFTALSSASLKTSLSFSNCAFIFEIIKSFLDIFLFNIACSSSEIPHSLNLLNKSNIHLSNS